MDITYLKGLAYVNQAMKLSGSRNIANRATIKKAAIPHIIHSVLA